MCWQHGYALELVELERIIESKGSHVEARALRSCKASPRFRTSPVWSSFSIDQVREPDRVSSAGNGALVLLRRLLQQPRYGSEVRRRRTGHLGGIVPAPQRVRAPDVLQDFRFHFSLTGALSDADREEAARAGRAASAAVARLSGEPLMFDAISVFEEPAPQAQLRAVHRSPLRRRGRLVYLVGPSGAGKDSLMAWVRERLPPESALAFAGRAITRPPARGGEAHEPVTHEEFAARLARGEFAMHWEANGHRYGIGREIIDQLEAGITVVVNGSRAYLPQARLAFRGLEVVHLTAPAGLLEQRLRRRKREDASAQKQRMTRDFRVPAAALDLVNEGALEVPATRFLRYLLGRLA